MSNITNTAVIIAIDHRTLADDRYMLVGSLLKKI
jgi:hypothetical protein